MFTKVYINFSDAQWQITPESVVVSGRNLNSSKRSCMFSLPARMKMIHSKISGHNIFPLFLWEFSRRTRAANSAVFSPTWPNFKLVRDFKVVLVTCKNEEDPTKNEGARVFTTLYINFSYTQGQITPK